MQETTTVSSKIRRVPARTIGDAPFVDSPFATALVELGKQRPEIVVLSADLSKYTDTAPFANTFPERFFQIGMAEQNMMGIAGGLAKTDFLPVAVTYSVFASRRACDQVQMALATGHRTAIIMGFLPGITTPFRASHQGTDDLAIMRSIPGMTVIDPMDATELASALRAAMAIPGPVYMRGLRGQVAEILEPGYDFSIGKPVLLREGNDIAFIGTGLGTQWALEATDLLRKHGSSVALLHVPTIKPFDRSAVASFVKNFERVVTVENHSIIGGLGSAVAEAIAQTGTATKLFPLGVTDNWAGSGPLDYLRSTLGLDAESIAIFTTKKGGGN